MLDSSSSGPRVLVTGANGFVGCYLVAALLARGCSVVGISRAAGWPAAWRHLESQVPLHVVDLCDLSRLKAVLHAVEPTQVYHLAGFARVGQSFREPDAAWNSNLLATRRLCEALLDQPRRPRVLAVSSGLIYGSPEPDQPPFDENSPLRPDSPYAASKAAADLVCYQYHCSDRLDILRARPFNHTGPFQPPEFVVPDFARQLAAIERGQQPPVLEVGDLTPQRDLSDVRDVVAAYLLLMERGRSGEAYNVASGQSWPIRHVLDRLIALSGLQVEVRHRADLLRPTDALNPRVNINKLCRETGWTPRYTLDQTLADTLASWRESL